MDLFLLRLVRDGRGLVESIHIPRSIFGPLDSSLDNMTTKLYAIRLLEMDLIFLAARYSILDLSTF